MICVSCPRTGPCWTVPRREFYPWVDGRQVARENRYLSRGADQTQATGHGREVDIMNFQDQRESIAEAARAATDFSEFRNALK